MILLTPVNYPCGLTNNIGVVDEARKIKPEIPETGERGIPIHDEIVMELTIRPYLDG